MNTRWLTASAALLLLLGCNDSPRSQERVRQDTANATAAIVSDAKAAALGIRDGLKGRAGNDAVNINTASESQLETLPGVTPAMAGQIISNRPYADPVELRKKHILPRDVYDKISGRLIIGR
ncbi:MAG: hypothetical protein NVSMB3_11900 [Acidobacteriaceae bacterium]